MKNRADAAALSVTVLTTIQGGILLSKVARDPRPLRLALDMALAHLGSFATPGSRPHGDGAAGAPG